MDSATDPVGTLDVALAHAAQLLQVDPRLAAEQADEILNVAPGHPIAQLTLGSAYRRQGDTARALGVLEPLVRTQPRWGVAQLELGLALANAHRGDDAILAFRRAVELKPDLPDAWRILGDHLTLLGDTEGADAAYARHIRHSTRDPRLLEPAAALCEGRIADAEHLLREHLKMHPTDVAAIRMLAEVGARIGRYGDAERLLGRCLELAPGFLAARHNLALVLQKQAKLAAAVAEAELLLHADPGNPGYRNLAASLAARLGDLPRAISIYSDVLREYPRQPKLWMSYGHTLKTAGRLDEAVDAYRRCLELAPHFGEAWWSLANLKTFRFSPMDIAAMRRQLDRKDLADEDRFHFDFALGKALEDAEDYAASFGHYEAGNRLRRRSVTWSAADNTAHVQRSKAMLTPDFFAARSGWGSPAPDVIFVVGLPRAGSTLIEQILSSHSQVEGTMELPDIIQIAREIGGGAARGPDSRYFEALAQLGRVECAQLGERYLVQTRIQRHSAAPFFIDKMPNNFAHVGLIHLLLPNAKIIDARRHPLGCCFSAFKQHFARGQAFSYSLDEVGRYYRDYVELMAHFDAVLPGRVHRVIYERMVEDTETEVRRLLDYCGLPFEPACLQFYRNDRAVRTASSEQVRRPIYRDGVDQWRHYEPWLEPLKHALGPIIDRYPTSSRS
ncbi:MAG: Beta-barrel assembly-enhancing protease [Steroidobacteraceae bacterium]|nr:Beta-barrel assembly-enhancing protease [Steroidobacteraceae bacterium]